MFFVSLCGDCGTNGLFLAPRDRRVGAGSVMLGTGVEAAVLKKKRETEVVDRHSVDASVASVS